MYKPIYPKLLIGILWIICIFFLILKYFTPILIISFCIFFVLIYRVFKDGKKNITSNILSLTLSSILILMVCGLVFNLPASSLWFLAAVIFVIMSLMALILDRFINKKWKKTFTRKIKKHNNGVKNDGS